MPLISGRPARVLRAGLGLLVWLVCSVTVALAIFVGSERSIDLASHDAVISPDFSGDLVLHTGPVLPDVRADSGSAIGVLVDLGKSDTTSLEELTQRYAAIASQPEGQIAVVERAVRSMAVSAAVQGAGVGAVPVLAWLALGRRRRRELLAGLRSRRGAVGAAVVVVVVAAVVVPTRVGRAEPAAQRWLTLPEFLGDAVPLPEEVRDVEITSDAATAQTRRLVKSAISTYEKSQQFYDEAAEAAALLDLREPADDETVVLLVSDRHDNVGMDNVARAIADNGGASAVYDAGDDTSTGERWEAFSLDSVSAAFADLDRWAVAGNHDNGTFVRRHMSELGWTYFDEDVVDGPGGSRLLGVDDPRSSGLGNWRDESGLSFAEVADRVTEAACAAHEDGRRIATLLLHDANMGKGALAAGCVDLVLGGHVHVSSGPTAVLGENGEVGYRYTVGTAGGAAYAIAIGSKLRRAAGVALLTYRDGRPVGIQEVTLQTNGRYDVDDWVPLDYTAPDEAPDDPAPKESASPAATSAP